MNDAEPKIPVSAMIFTFNEEIHLPSSLAALDWCDDIIVVDSMSTDRTEAICREHGVRFFERPFDDLARQRNWGLEATEPKHEWVLILDADERVTPELRDELQRRLAHVPEKVAAYRLKRRFHMWGRWLKHSSTYPTWVVRLLRRGRVHFFKQGHGEGQQVDGEIRALACDLIDENLKGSEAWMHRQVKYAHWEAAHELQDEAEDVALADLLAADPLARRVAAKRILARMPGRAMAYFAYSYLWRGGILEGRDGLAFCMMKSLYQQMIVASKYDMRRQQHHHDPCG